MRRVSSGDRLYASQSTGASNRPPEQSAAAPSSRASMPAISTQQPLVPGHRPVIFGSHQMVQQQQQQQHASHHTPPRPGGRPLSGPTQQRFSIGGGADSDGEVDEAPSPSPRTARLAVSSSSRLQHHQQQQTVHHLQQQQQQLQQIRGSVIVPVGSPSNAPRTRSSASAAVPVPNTRRSASSGAIPAPGLSSTQGRGSSGYLGVRIDEDPIIMPSSSQTASGLSGGPSNSVSVTHIRHSSQPLLSPLAHSRSGNLQVNTATSSPNIKFVKLVNPATRNRHRPSKSGHKRPLSNEMADGLSAGPPTSPEEDDYAQALLTPQADVHIEAAAFELAQELKKWTAHVLHPIAPEKFQYPSQSEDLLSLRNNLWFELWARRHKLPNAEAAADLASRRAACATLVQEFLSFEHTEVAMSAGSLATLMDKMDLAIALYPSEKQFCAEHLTSQMKAFRRRWETLSAYINTERQLKQRLELIVKWWGIKEFSPRPGSSHPLCTTQESRHFVSRMVLKRMDMTSLVNLVLRQLEGILLQTRHTLLQFGKKFKLLHLPSLIPLFIYLARVPLALAQQCLEVRLDNVPPRLSPLSAPELVRQFKEAMTQSFRVREFHMDMIADIHDDSSKVSRSRNLYHFETKLRETLLMYFQLLQRWMQAVVQTSMSPAGKRPLIDVLEEHWETSWSLAKSIRTGPVDGAKSFCEMTAFVLRSLRTDTALLLKQLEADDPDKSSSSDEDDDAPVIPSMPQRNFSVSLDDLPRVVAGLPTSGNVATASTSSSGTMMLGAPSGPAFVPPASPKAAVLPAVDASALTIPLSSELGQSRVLSGSRLKAVPELILAYNDPAEMTPNDLATAVSSPNVATGSSHAGGEASLGTPSSALWSNFDDSTASVEPVVKVQIREPTRSNSSPNLSNLSLDASKLMAPTHDAVADDAQNRDHKSFLGSPSLCDAKDSRDGLTHSAYSSMVSLSDHTGFMSQAASQDFLPLQRVDSLVDSHAEQARYDEEAHLAFHGPAGALSVDGLHLDLSQPDLHHSSNFMSSPPSPPSFAKPHVEATAHSQVVFEAGSVTSSPAVTVLSAIGTGSSLVSSQLSRFISEEHDTGSLHHRPLNVDQQQQQQQQTLLQHQNGNLFDNLSSRRDDSSVNLLLQTPQPIMDSNDNLDSDAGEMRRHRLVKKTREMFSYVRRCSLKTISFVKRLIHLIETGSEFALAAPLEDLLSQLAQKGWQLVRGSSVAHSDPALLIVPPILCQASVTIQETALAKLLGCRQVTDRAVPIKDDETYMVVVPAKTATGRNAMELWTGEVVQVSIVERLSIPVAVLADISVQPDHVLLVSSTVGFKTLHRKIFAEAVPGLVEWASLVHTCPHRSVRGGLEDVLKEVRFLTPNIINAISQLEPVFGKVAGVSAETHVNRMQVLQKAYASGLAVMREAMRFAGQPATLECADFVLNWMKFVLRECPPQPTRIPPWAIAGLKILEDHYANLYLQLPSAGTREDFLQTGKAFMCHMQPRPSSSVPVNSPLDLRALGRTPSDLNNPNTSGNTSPVPFVPSHRRTRSDGSIKKVKGKRPVFKSWLDIDGARDDVMIKSGMIGRISDTPKTTATSTVSAKENIYSMLKKYVYNLRWLRGRKLGAGQFGEVFICIDQDNPRQLAVKEMHLQLTDNDRSSTHLVPPAAIRDEMKIMDQIDHKNIVKHYGIELHSDRVFLFMEYCSEGTLSENIHTGRIMGERDIRQVTAQLLDAVSYLHSRGIVHGDIKTDNIFFDHNYVLKLGDFGLAKKLKQKVRTRKGELTRADGTPHYWAPEIITGERNAGHGRKVDIWSCGCCILEMFTGERPWANISNEWQIGYRLGFTQDLPGLLPPEISQDAREVTELCFLRDPQKRPWAEDLLKMSWFQRDL